MTIYNLSAVSTHEILYPPEFVHKKLLVSTLPKAFRAKKVN